MEKKPDDLTKKQLWEGGEIEEGEMIKYFS